MNSRLWEWAKNGTFNNPVTLSGSVILSNLSVLTVFQPPGLPIYLTTYPSISPGITNSLDVPLYPSTDTTVSPESSLTYSYSHSPSLLVRILSADFATFVLLP